MATSTEAQRPDATHYVDYEEYVDFQLEKTRSSIKLTDVFTTLTALAVVVITYLLVFVVIDQWVLEEGFGYAARVSLLSVLLAGVLGMLTWRVFLPLFRRVHPLYAARIIEKSDPNLKSNLVNFVDVREANAQSAPVVLKAMEKRAAVELSHIDVEEAVDRRPLLRIAYALLGVVVVCALYIIFSPKDPFASVRRALLPTAAIDVATETTITDVDPGDTQVPARTYLTITAEVRGKDADSARILYTTADHKYVDESVAMKREEATLPRFKAELKGENGRGVLQNLTYRIVAGDARTKEYVVEVNQPPSARVDDVQYEYPSYMELERRQTTEANIDGWEGATVTVRATTNIPVEKAWIVTTDIEDSKAKGEEYAMQVSDGTKLSGTLKLDFRSDGSAPRFYRIDVKTAKDETDSDPTQYTFRIRPDQRPEVALLAPTADLDMPANGVIPLIIQAADPDFKVRSILLKVERKGDAFPDQKLFESELPRQAYRGKHDFALTPLKLGVGDTIQIRIEARDNKHPTANRSATTPINIHIGKPASAKEVQDQLAAEKEKQNQIAKNENQVNPERPDAPLPSDADDGPDSEKPRPRPDQPEPQQRGKQEDQPRENEPDNAAEKPEEGKNGEARERKPADNLEALQKFLQKDREKQAGDNGPEQERQQPRDKNPDAKNENNSNQKQQEKKSPGPNPKNSRTGNDPARQPDKATKNDKPEQENRPDGQEQKPGDKSPSNPEKPGKNDDQEKSSDRNDTEKRKSPAGDEEEQDNAGGQGKNDKAKNSAKPDGDPSGKSPSEKWPKPKPDGDKGQTGDAQSDNANEPRQPGPGKKPGEKDQSGDTANAPKKDEAKANNPAGKNGDDDANQNDPGKKPGKKDGGTGNDAGKPDEPGKGDQADPKNDQPKSDQSGDDSQKPGDDRSPEKQKNKAQGGAGKEETKADPAGPSKDPSKAKGTASKSKTPEGDDEQSGDGDGQKTRKKIGGDDAKQTREGDDTGEEKPAEDSPDAVKKKANGDEPGEATGDNEGDPQAPKASDKVNKKPGSEPGAKQESSGNPDQNPKKSDDKRKPDDGSPGSSADPDRAKRAPSGKEPADQPGKLDDPQSPRRSEPKNKGNSEERPGQPPDAGNPPLVGENKKNQKSPQPDSGEEGSGEAAEQGKKGANKTGSGDKSDEPGDTDPSKGKTGRPGSKKGQGSTTKPSDEEGQRDAAPGKEPGKSPSSKNNTGKPGEKGDQSGAENQPGKESDQSGSKSPDGKPGKDGDGKPGEKSDQKGGKPGAGGKSSEKPPSGKANDQGSKPGKPGNTGNSRFGNGIDSPPGEGGEPGDGKGGASDEQAPPPREGASDDEPPSSEEEEANLEHARKATNLVLTRLKSQLDRGEVDQQLLDELGWKDRKDVEKLVNFLEKGLNDRDEDSSPEAVARRRQFEETLKSLRLGSETGRKSGGEGPTRQIRQIGTRNVPVPPEYRKLYESYTRSLSKTAEPAAGKKK